MKNLVTESIITRLRCATQLRALFWNVAVASFLFHIWVVITIPLIHIISYTNNIHEQEHLYESHYGASELQRKGEYWSISQLNETPATQHTRGIFIMYKWFWRWDSGKWKRKYTTRSQRNGKTMDLGIKRCLSKMLRYVPIPRCNTYAVTNHQIPLVFIDGQGYRRIYPFL